ncbi:MAG: NusA-like transcription termination signal-binding factor [Euryarchaeota archaeon]|nr:NusA-like transcription termination signal-binding factor [Euryarchaeota archaeon]
MAEITFNEETIRYVSLFQDMTRTTVIDCLDTPDRLHFVVKHGDIAKAIGMGGEHVAALRRKMNKDIHIVEYNDDPKTFVANVFRSYDVKKVDIETRENGVVHATVTVDPLKKGRAIGKEGRNLRVFRDLIARHHAIQSVSVA